MQSRSTCFPLSAPGGGEGWGEVGDSRTLADTHLTLPLLRNGSLPLPPRGRRGEMQRHRLLRRFSRRGAAPGGEVGPAVGFHELRPAAVEVAQIVLARGCRGQVDDSPWQAEPFPFVILDF